MTVHRFLVTADDVDLMAYSAALAGVINPIERRGQTVLVTCFDEHRDLALGVAAVMDVTVQERIEGEEPGPLGYWPVVVQGAMPPWEDDRS